MAAPKAQIHDFDKAFEASRAARSKTPQKFKLFGSLWEVHKSLPAGVLIDTIARGRDVEQSIEALADFIETLLVKDAQKEKWQKALRDFDNAITISDLNDIVQWAIGMYAGRPMEQ